MLRRVKQYFVSRNRDLLGRTISVTGHSHYEAYAGEWGARCIGLEVGENIAFTQSKFAFARGAATCAETVVGSGEPLVRGRVYDKRPATQRGRKCTRSGCGPLAQSL